MEPKTSPFTLKITSELDHGSEVFGVAWNPFMKDEYAVGCLNGDVYLCNMNLTIKKALTGTHFKRIFHVVYSPAIPNMLASGSDD
jgi:hypothetical protein